ncbi:MAG: hypothetical protein ROR55_17745 [Devosia sp.]
MKPKDTRLQQYLDKVEQQYEWDRFREQNAASSSAPERPSLEKEEKHAQAMGWGEKFELEAMSKRWELEQREIKEVARVSPNAAALYGSQISSQGWQALERFAKETDNGISRAMRRWEKQEQIRYPERGERALARFGASTRIRMPWEEPLQKTPPQAQGGFARHAKRESTLEKARQFTAQQQNQKDRSPGRG